MRGLANLEGVFGCVEVRWNDLGRDATSGKVCWPKAFARPFPDFRRLDPLSRFCCLAAEATGAEFSPRTALVLATTYGCMHADREFARSLETIPAAGVFPYTLPSTCLGDLAIRHRLTGPSLCLTTPDVSEGMVEARRLVELAEADAALVCMGDVLPPHRASILAVLLR